MRRGDRCDGVHFNIEKGMTSEFPTAQVVVKGKGRLCEEGMGPVGRAHMATTARYFANGGIVRGSR